jgi:hypothetical protein
VTAILYRVSDKVLRKLQQIQNSAALLLTPSHTPTHSIKIICIIDFYSAFLNTQRCFTNKKGIHTDSTDTQTKGKKINNTTTIGNTLRERERVKMAEDDLSNVVGVPEEVDTHSLTPSLTHLLTSASATKTSGSFLHQTTKTLHKILPDL